MKKIISLLMVFTIILSAVNVSAASIGGKKISSQGAFVMDFKTGKQLYSYNGDVPRAPGSMTKIMSMYVVFEAIKNGEIRLDTVTKISKNVYDISRNKVYQSVLPLNYNTNYRVDELIDVVLVYSACGATLALAELVSGSEAAFVKRMNETAWRMGMNAQYFDCMGIANNQVSPRAMATLARNTIIDFPQILNITSKKSVKFHGRSYSSTNKLLSSYYYQGADGLKTGTTSLAGYCFCGTATRNGERVITVTMASSSGSQRFVDTKIMLDYGFNIIAPQNYIYTTNIKASINNTPIPCFYTKKFNGCGMIIAEDLGNYGYDVRFDGETKTLYLTYNPEKPVTGINMSYYNSLIPNNPFMKYYTNTVKVIIEKDGQTFTPERVLMLDGYMAIGIDELQNVCESFHYDGANNTIQIQY